METSGIEVRWLTQEEFDVIAQIFAIQGGAVPDPDYCKIAGAFADQQLVGFMCLQYVAHAEPTWIAETHQGTGLWRNLADFVSNFATGRALYVCAPDDRVAHMCSEYGFSRIGDLYERKE
jgi:hypothetical protein